MRSDRATMSTSAATCRVPDPPFSSQQHREIRVRPAVVTAFCGVTVSWLTLTRRDVGGLAAGCATLPKLPEIVWGDADWAIMGGRPGAWCAWSAFGGPVWILGSQVGEG